MRMNRLVMGLAVGLLWLAGATAARADSQPFTGTAGFNYTDIWQFGLSGPTLSAFTSYNGGPDTLLSCYAGVVCDVSDSQYGVVGLDIMQASFLVYQGNLAPYYTGNIRFSSSFILPYVGLSTTPGNIPMGAAEPVTVSGEFFAYSSYGGTLLYTVSLAGNGTFSGGGFYEPSNNYQYNFQSVTYSYSGIADVTTPEPSSLLLLATGLLGLLILSCRRLFAPAQHPACD